MRISRRGFLGAAAAGTAVALTQSILDHAGLNGGARAEARQAERTSALRASSLEGSYYDAAGTLLTEPTDAPGPAALCEPELFSWIIGYNSPQYGVSGIRKTLQENGLDLAAAPGGRGASVYLTIQRELQAVAVDLCRGFRASCIVVDAENGSLLAYANSPSPDLELDANHVDAAFMQAANAETEFWYPATSKAVRPGSQYKIVDSAVILENNIDPSFQDPGVYRGIHNFNQRKYDGTIDLNFAAQHSVNTYYAAKMEQAGYSAWSEMSRKFGVNEGKEPLEESARITLENGESTAAYQCVEGELGNLVVASIGEGTVEAAPISLVRFMGAVVSSTGGIFSPYLVHHVEQEDGTVLWDKPEPQPVSEPLADPEPRQQMQQLFASVAAHYKLSAPGASLVTAKTGTSERDKAEGINDIFINGGICTASGRRLAFVLSRHGVKQTSSALMEPVQQLLDHLAAL